MAYVVTKVIHYYKCDNEDKKRLVDKMKNDNETYRSLAKKMGKGFSHSFINQIFIGKKEFSLETANDFSKFGYILIEKVNN